MNKEDIEWTEVAQKDLDEIHDIAEELWLSLQRKELFEDSEKAKKIRDTIERDTFYKEGVVEDER